LSHTVPKYIPSNFSDDKEFWMRTFSSTYLEGVTLGCASSDSNLRGRKSWRLVCVCVLITAGPMIKL